MRTALGLGTTSLMLVLVASQAVSGMQRKNNRIDYDDPKTERVWCRQQLATVRDYLAAHKVAAGDLPAGPSWLLAPYIAVWRVNLKSGGAVWVISGDLPTDYLPRSTAATPRDAVRGFAERWERVAANMRAGKKDPEITIGKPKDQKHLGDLLEKRAAVLKDFAARDELWQE
jgi:hypothetical protein